MFGTSDTGIISTITLERGFADQYGIRTGLRHLSQTSFGTESEEYFGSEETRSQRVGIRVLNKTSHWSRR